MKKTFSSKKSAFSLIELSIVLIIIGLLIAGVTGGASLIKSSELRSAISESRGWSTAVNGFYNQFNAFPGDYTSAIGGGNSLYMAGNGNAQINSYTVAANPSGTLSTAAACAAAVAPQPGCAYEDNVAWIQLKNAGVIDTNTISGTGIAAAAWSVAQNATFGVSNPASKIKSSGWVFDYNTTALQNVVVLTGAIATAPGVVAANTYVNGTPVSTASINPADALSMDTKVDDGVSNTGRTRAVSPGAAGTCFVAATFAYATSNTSKTCALSFQVDLG